MGKTYDLKLVVCTIGGVPISGYGETDALTLEWVSDIVEGTVTADGKALYSRLNDRRLNVTVTLSQTSRVVGLLQTMLDAQHGETLPFAPPQILPVPFYLLDPSTGDTIASFETVFMARPAPSKGRNVGEVQFMLQLPSPAVSLGAANLI
jgi:hypothetical protein